MNKRTLWVLAFALGCASDRDGEDLGLGLGYFDTGPLQCEGEGARYVTRVAELRYGPGQDFGQSEMPNIVYGPPQGGGIGAGSLDVVSLGNGGVIGVAFANNGIVDGPGDDFVVYENPFESGQTLFAELGTVEVSMDGEIWTAFPCTATESPYDTCAGHTPVHPDGEGGDRFDLADIDRMEARYVRITDRVDLDGEDGVFDLDAVGILNPACP